jgi:hypothetical protein
LNGALYGTTASASNGKSYGTVFEVSTSGAERLLHRFEVVVGTANSPMEP